MQKKKVGIIISNPIDHEIPLFQNLALFNDIDLTVIFLDKEGIKNFNAFGLTNINYGVDVLEGYKYTFLKNISPFKSLRWKYINPSISKYLRNNRFDVVISYGYNSITTLIALVVCNRIKVPILLRTEAESVQRISGKKKLIREFILPFIYRKYNGFLSLCKANADHYIKYHVSPDIIWDVPQTILYNNFFKIQNPALNLRERFSIPEKDVVFIYGSKLRNEKRPEDVIKAFCSLGENVEAHLVVLSDGPLRKKCESLVASTNKSHKVTFTGYLDFNLLIGIYQSSDVLIASSSETVGSVLFQGLTAGLAIVSSDKIAGWFDIIEPGLNGLIYQYGVVEDLATKIEWLANDPALVMSMKINSKKLAEKFDPACTAKKLLDVLTR